MRYEPEAAGEGGEFVFHRSSMIGTAVLPETRSTLSESLTTRLGPLVWDYSSGLGGFLRSFVWDLFRFSSTRFFLADRDGFVERLEGGSGLAAPSSIASRRRRALLRFVAWDRDRSSTIRISGPTLLTMRARERSSIADDVSTSKRSSTRVEVLFACWPPGPPVGENRHWSSRSGMLNDRAPSMRLPRHRTLRG